MSVDRGFTWMDDETVALIEIFSKADVQEELQGAKRNITVYEKIAQELSNIGFTRTAYQCREKIKRLRKEYQHIKHCISTNTKPKKPMKYFDLVNKIFDRSSTENGNIINLANSENEEEIYPSLRGDKESDASNSFLDNEHISSHSILPETSFSDLDDDNSQMLLEVKLSNSSLMKHNNNDDSLFLNEDQTYDLSEKDSALDNMDSPWVPNVVLEETSNKDLESTDNDEEENLSNFNNPSENEGVKDSVEPPRKKKKQNMLQLVLDKVTEKFLSYQTEAESRFFDKISQLEKERMKRDEDMQRLWIEFEERRRRDEQEHELKMLSLLGTFMSQISENGTSSKPA